MRSTHVPLTKHLSGMAAVIFFFLCVIVLPAQAEQSSSGQSVSGAVQADQTQHDQMQPKAQPGNAQNTMRAQMQQTADSAKKAPAKQPIPPDSDTVINTSPDTIFVGRDPQTGDHVVRAKPRQHNYQQQNAMPYIVPEVNIDAGMYSNRYGTGNQSWNNNRSLQQNPYWNNRLLQDVPQKAPTWSLARNGRSLPPPPPNAYPSSNLPPAQDGSLYPGTNSDGTYPNPPSGVYPPSGYPQPNYPGYYPQGRPPMQNGMIPPPPGRYPGQQRYPGSWGRGWHHNGYNGYRHGHGHGNGVYVYRPWHR